MTNRPADPVPGELAALVGSRICHDLVNPLGAIGNGLELLGIAAAGVPGGAVGGGPEAALLAESLALARARLQLFRLAYGAAAEGQRAARAELCAALAAAQRGSRLAVDWAIAGDPPRPRAKLALLLVQCAETALPRGSRISVAADPGGPPGRWRLDAAGPRLRIEPAHWAGLAGPESPAGIGPSEVQFPLAAMELRRQRCRLVADLGPDRLVLQF